MLFCSAGEVDLYETFSLPFLTSWLKVGIVFLLSFNIFPASCQGAEARNMPFMGKSTQLVIIAKEKGDVKNFLPFLQNFL
jgi:hypothetical protein